MGAARMPLWYAVDVIYDQFPTLFVMFWTIGILVAAMSTFITVFLMYEHYRTGLTKLGFMNAETNFTIKILALQPVFVFTALLSLFEPDMGYFFEAIQTLMLGWVLFYLISYCVYVLGGSAKFLQHATSSSKTQLWNHFPGCCVWIFFRFCCKTLDKESTPTVEQIMGPVRCAAFFSHLATARIRQHHKCRPRNGAVLHLCFYLGFDAGWHVRSARIVQLDQTY